MHAIRATPASTLLRPRLDWSMTAWERLQLLAGGFGEEQAERALELLSPLIGADARSRDSTNFTQIDAPPAVRDASRLTLPAEWQAKEVSGAAGRSSSCRRGRRCRARAAR